MKRVFTKVKKLLQIMLPVVILERLGFFISRIQQFIEGTYPLFVAKRKLKISASNPDTFNKKIRYKMAHDRRPILTTFADKVAVRDYVADKVGRKYLTNVYAVLDKVDLDAFNPRILPRNFVIKVNHGSGGIIIISDREDESKNLPNKSEIKSIGWARLSIHPDKFDWNLVKTILTKWMNMNYYYFPGYFPEWAYKNILPKVIIEEFLSDSGNELNDFRFYTFNGKCQFIATGSPFYSQQGLERNFYSTQWDLIPVRGWYPNSKIAVTRPENLEEMIEVSESVSVGIDHVRVDLYSLKNRIVFGELTNYTNGGIEKFIPDSFNYEFGSSWHPERSYPSR